jgi:PAS domain S-box-containing protein
MEQLLDSAPDALIIINEGGTIRLVNRQAEILFGYAPQALVGQSVELLVPDRLRDLHPHLRAGYFAQPTTRPMGAGLELTARRMDGSEFPVDISLSSVETSEGILVSAAVRDITDRKRSEAKFQGLLEAAPDAILAVDNMGKIRMVNRQAQALFGYAREELIGTDLDILVPAKVRDVHPRHRASYFAHPTTRPMGAGLQLAARRKDGSEFPVDISLSALETEDGVLVSAAVRDITDRRRAEEERVALEVKLHRAEMDEERTRNEARLSQVQRLESIGQLAGGVAHDFNNLLAAIMNYAALISHELTRLVGRAGLTDDPDAVTLAEDIEGIKTVATQAAELTRQLLIFSRREVITPEILDLNAVVIDTERLLRRTIGEDVDLGTDLTHDVPRIKADRGQVEQVLMNLAVNARDAMPGGGVLRIETSAVEVDETFAGLHGITPGTYVQLAVSDTGSGMTSQVQQHAFEPFFTTKSKTMGTGLGLATVYGIATQAGGNVILYSEPGLGTTVRVIFPATDALPPAKASQAAAAVLSGHEVVLLVEDARMVREPTRRILEQYGYRALAASNADEALDVFGRHPGEIDLLLTDVIMPGRSGKELVAEVRLVSPRTRVLYMSGYSHDVIVHQGVLEEGAHLIEKPFPVESLLRRIREILDAE